MNFIREILTHQNLTKDISTMSIGMKCPPLTCVGEPVRIYSPPLLLSILKSDVQISPLMFSVM